MKIVPVKAFSIHILCTLLVLTVSISLQAQDFGWIKGVVKENNKPVEFANVFLTLPRDTTKIVLGVVTDSDGRFLLDNVPPEDYTLNIRMIGFTLKQLPISIRPGAQNIDLHEIAIEADVHQLNAVEVTAMRDLIQRTEEGYVVKASENITQIGGSAADLLKNMPGVLVNSDGDVTIRGKTPLTLINGRISGIAGIDRSAQLERIPASSIERIEIINNPSAKYDADAEGGIINIVLKKNEDRGTNGAFAVGMGRGSRYRLNASMLLNHKTRKWNVGAAYDNWYTTRTRRVTGDRINYDLSDEHFLAQRRFDERLIFYQNAKTTVDFTPNEKNSFNFEALWAFPGENNNETLKNTYTTSENEFTSRNQRHSNEIRRSHALELSLLYTRHFDNPAKLLSVNVSNTFNIEKENTDIDTQPLTEQDDASGDISLQRTHVYQKTNLANIALDYAQPIAKNGTLEMGYKSIFRYLNSDFIRANFTNEEYITDPLNSNIFDFHEQIHAVYTQFTGWTGEKEAPLWKYNAGLRAEKVWNNGKTRDDSEAFKNEYFNLFPSANLFYYTPQRNYFKLSYTRRIARPGLGQLNPFTDITDSLNQHSGNSRLKPEIIHAFELGYNYTLPKASLSLSAFYRLRKNAIFSYTILDENGVALSLPMNFGTASTLGMEAIASYNPFSFWSMNLSLSAYQTHIDNTESGAELSTNLVSWYSKLIQNFTLFKESKLQVIGNYTSPSAVPQGKSIAVYFVDIGFQQRIMKGKGRLGLVVTDVFNTQQYGFITSDYNFESNRHVKIDTRAVLITFGYTFGTSFKENLMDNKFEND
ncbi:TonB-dependent receptor domain-containing protein [Chryseolinea soli]|uniref:TonB-dependent receptor n=1 Tax=Chryseolinea soli TaxID=2321403 RepID=A0A385SIG2_9BACT|nr:TonB-dependent receptor [Chryseolinea soli]AYB29150.1 TonB-dependent receptor [Chryseolinea soli]